MRIIRICKKWSKHAVGVLKVAALFISIIILVQIYRITTKVQYPSQAEMLAELEELLRDLVIQEKGSGCQLPDLDPFSPEATMFDIDFPTIGCAGDDWVECIFSECYVKKSILDRMKDVTCAYKDIVYVNSNDYYLGKAVEIKGDGKYLLNESDCVKVACTGMGIGNGTRLEWEGRKVGLRPITPVTTTKALKNPLNVFFLVLDSVSRNTFIRKMPKSYQVLKNELLAVVMDGHNIVGCGTDGALWPILTGHNDMEVPDSRKIPSNKRHVDPKDFIFTLLKGYGYRTGYFEDLGWDTTFNCRYNGFASMPTDHYIGHLTQELGGTLDSLLFCFGSEPHFKFMVELSNQLFKVDGNKFCLTVIASYSHESLNYLPLADEQLAPFLKKFKREGHLNDTLLFVMGDHGTRQSGIRNTYQGKIEEHLPFMSIVLPEKLKASRPDALRNLIANSKVLTTHFDIHTTVLDALGLREHRNKYKVPGADLERGLSLFEPIPKSRACAEAGIVPHLCACARWQNVSIDDEFYARTAQELARFINGVVAQTSKCARRTLLSTEWVHRLSPKIDMFGFTTKAVILDKFFAGKHRSRNIFNQVTARPMIEYYQAKIVMAPGRAVFEGTMQYNAREDAFSVSSRDVSRVSRYGNEPYCVMGTHPLLARFCYCVDFDKSKILAERQRYLPITQQNETFRL